MLFTVNALTVVVLQLPLNRTTGASGAISRAAPVIPGALLLMATGFAAASLGTMPSLIACVVLLSLGEALRDPRVDSEVTASVPAHRHGMAFGFVGTAIAADCATANDLAAALSSDHGAVDRRFWLLLLAVGLGFAALVYVASLAVSFTTDGAFDESPAY